MDPNEYKDYGYTESGLGDWHARVLPDILRFAGELPPGTRVLDVGCGSGYICGEFLRRQCDVVGIDLSSQGIAIAASTYPKGRFEVMAADGSILSNLNEKPFDLVLSTEVIEHLYAPSVYARGCFEALRPGGRFICTTPYHGYLKNLIIALAGKFDSHVDPLWHGGHIKFWSRRTLTQLLREAGFQNMDFRGAGRFVGLWKTMVMCCDKPPLRQTGSAT